MKEQYQEGAGKRTQTPSNICEIRASTVKINCALLSKSYQNKNSIRSTSSHTSQNRHLYVLGFL